jgi:hypothetical protein
VNHWLGAAPRLFGVIRSGRLFKTGIPARSSFRNRADKYRETLFSSGVVVSKEPTSDYQSVALEPDKVMRIDESERPGWRAARERSEVPDHVHLIVIVCCVRDFQPRHVRA